MRLDIVNHGYRPGTKAAGCSPGSRCRTRQAGLGDAGPSAWPVGDRELMAAYVSTVNGSATQAYRDRLAGGGGACRPGVRPHRGAAAGHAADARQADGGGRGGAGDVRGALAVCAAFNTTGWLADAFGFEVLSPGGFAPGAKYLLKRGYR
jgi:hypothetical protein